ncbi:MAG: discoidin domain-containing protein [Phycisphaerae bacterium]|nr:discoidin domain-containing protein [Phycisphaerae bacterium]
MKTGLLCLGLVLSVMAATATAGFSEPQGVPWAEWRFTGDFDAAHEIRADKASDPESLIRRNPATNAVSISGGKVVFTQTGPADFLRVDIDDLVENGGGGYANAYTMIFDLKALEADWLPLYNTGYNNYNAADFWADADGAVGSGAYSEPGAVPLGTWVRLVVVRRLEGATWFRDAYVNGTKVLDNLEGEGLDGNSSLYTNAQQGEGQFTILSDSDATTYGGCELDSFAFVAAAMSDEEIADLGAYRTQGIFGIAGIASEPAPADEAFDVPRDTSLAWKAGEFAATHDVYFGAAFDDVNDASRDDPRGVLTGRDQTDAQFTPEGIEYGQTYYWRIDEVNAAPDDTTFKGDVWSFTVEPFAYPITGVTATASSAQPGMGPENTVDGSGLDDQDRHSTDLTQMWMSSGKPAWIQFEFDRVYKLDRMLVWNSNQLIETYLGFGAKSVVIEYSADGATWAELADVPEFAKASGTAAYTANTTVDFLGATAKFVKLTINANWGGAAPQTGLSEVRFFYIPVQARGPVPADGATGVGIDAELNWRPGREAESHEVYFGTDPSTMIWVGTPSEHSYTPGLLDFAMTYFWAVDEVGGDGPYAGEVWSFTTQEYATIDDFEIYNDDDNRIYDSWIDGLTTGASGSQVGYDVSPFAERRIVHSGRQSMPLAYDNSASPFYSEAERTFASPQNWTVAGADTLTLFFQGGAEPADNSPEGLYVTIKDSSNKSKTMVHPDAAATTRVDWQQWKIPLTEFTSAGVKVGAVRSITIGVGNRTSPAKGGAGRIFLDDIAFGVSLP